MNKGVPMQKYFLFSILIIALLTSCASSANAQPQEKVEETATSIPQKVEATEEVVSKVPPADCPVTTADQSKKFLAPEPLEPIAPWKGLFWFGGEHLWTALHDDGVWTGLPYHEHGYTQKIMWWSSLYNLPDELEPALVVTAKRLDGDAPPLGFYDATNAMAKDIGEAMLTGVEFPTLGCWEVTGQYKKTSLTFVVWITAEE
jgi:hypothetical protein